MAKLFDFIGYGEARDAVECPELEALIDDLDAAFKKHGVGFGIERGYDEPDKIILVPLAQADHDFMTLNLEDASPDIPWIVAARSAAMTKRDARYSAERSAAAAKQDALQKAKTEQLLRDGIELGGKRYKLTPET